MKAPLQKKRITFSVAVNKYQASLGAIIQKRMQPENTCKFGMDQNCG